MSAQFDTLIAPLRTKIGKMSAALDAVTDAIVWTDEKGRIKWWNTLFETLVQKERQLIFNRDLADILPLHKNGHLLSADKHPVQRVLAEQSQGTNCYEFCQNKTQSILEISWGPVKFSDSHTSSAVLAIRDVTEKKKSEAELEQYRAQLESLVEERTTELVVVNEKLQSELTERRRIENLLARRETAIRTLYDITTSLNLSFRQSIQNLLQFGCDQFNLPIGVFSKIKGGQYNVYAARLPDASYVQDISLPIENTYCHDTINHGQALCILNAGSTTWAQHPCYEALRLEAYFGIPVLVNGDIYGTLSFSSRTVREDSFDDFEKELLKLMTQWVGREIERQHAAIALSEARDSALAATKAKSDFLATMSHEIRTPMNAVIGMAGLLLDTDLSAEQRNFVDVIRNGGNSLLSLINDILDFSKIESGHLELEESPFNLRTCLEEAVDLVATRAIEKNLELTYQISPTIPETLIGDVTRLRQIIVNLLNNAVKFTHQGEIVVTVDSHSPPVLGAQTDDQVNVQVDEQGVKPKLVQELCFSVRDTGIGIPEQQMGRLFQTFSQVDSSTTRKYGGTGLGLAISKQLVQMMGGKIWVESKVDKGTTFSFTVPAQGSFLDSNQRLSSVVTALTDKRFLIVDDNTTNRQILEQQVQSWGGITRSAASGKEALEYFEQGEYFDLALLDMQMPCMDGVMLAQKIHGFSKYRALPLVMLTSIGQHQFSEIDIKTHFVAWLNKPIRQAQLLDTLNKVFANSSIQSEQLKDPYNSRVDNNPVDDSIDHDLANKLPLKILIAEDNSINQQLVIQLLKRMGYRTDVVGNGLEVLHSLEQQSYDVILMDLQMPELDGIETTRKVHQRYASTAKPWIIAVTANAMQGDREKCLNAGMDDYISKPIRVADLISALKRVPLRQQDLPERAPETSLVFHPSTAETEAIQTEVALDIDPSEAGFNGIDYQQLCDSVSMIDDANASNFLELLISTYLEESPLLIQSMKTAIVQQNSDALYFNAHTLKSSSWALGIRGVADVCQAIEHMGQQDQIDDAENMLKKLHQEYQSVEEFLSIEVDKLLQLAYSYSA